ncbi:hypothetical protein KIW84_054542 [Lathyrus oleraceus]|uniref:DNA ligase ATP-dependent N-terminal domain-containing protein n=1 Tax=Pisum sativum TaxID=3888 RepID=A0A9D5AII6_PEA|nr:hypothetical protein KIW84_054542 [Pisum sativum]
MTFKESNPPKELQGSVAKESGKDSQEKKKNHIKSLLVAAFECEPLCIIRLLQSKLRIGYAKQTLLAALGHAAVYSEEHSKSPPGIQSLRMAYGNFQRTASGELYGMMSATCNKQQRARQNRETSPSSGLPINLKGKRAFITGVADDNGYGWAIAKSLAAAGAEILLGTWVPALNISESSLRRGKFDESRVLPDGSLLEITKVYPLDAVFDNLEDVPEDIKSNKRYAGSSKWTVQEVAESVKEDFGSIDILVHSLVNGPEKAQIRINTIPVGPLRSRAAKAIGFIDMMIDYSIANAPLQKELSAEEVGNASAFLSSPLASTITGTVLYVDNGLNAMGVGVDSPIFSDLNIPKEQH